MSVPANTIDLTTTAAAQAYLAMSGNSLTATADLIQGLVTAISAWAMTFCSRDFRLTAYSEVYNGKGNDAQCLRQTPVLSIQSLAVDGVAITQAVTQPLNAGFAFDDSSVYLFDPYCFTRSYQNVQIGYTAGYVTPGMVALGNINPITLPQDLQQAVNEAVADRYRRRDNIGIAGKSIAGETITFTQDDLPKSAMPVFLAYRRMALV